MSKRKHFRPNRRAPAYKHFERILKEDKIYQWKQKQPIKRLTLNPYVIDGYYYEAKCVKDAIACNLHKNGNYKYGSRSDENGRE